MSLITRCPACTTLFKVVPDQLRVSEGWVRCGQCDEVFDANLHLQGNPAVPTADELAKHQPVTQVDANPHTVDTVEPHESISVDTEPQMPSDPEPELQQALSDKLEWPNSPSQDVYECLMDVRPGAVFDAEPALQLDFPAEPVAHEIDAELPDPEPEEWIAPHIDDEIAASPEHSQISEPDARLDDFRPVQEPVPAPTFMRGTHTASTSSSPWVRRGLGLLALLLTLGLMAHMVWRERDRLAANIPDLRPGLNAMCSALNCTIRPYKHIDTVIIDSSSFVKVRGDVYRLNLTLKNTASIEIAAPAVELTLTDLQDQPMIRHILNASELGAKEGILAAGGELTTAVPVQVKLSAPADRISGYRLLAFYP